MDEYQPVRGADDDAFDLSTGLDTPDPGDDHPDSEHGRVCDEDADQASFLRGALASFRDAEQARGEISQLRRDAASDAELMISQAQAAAKRLLEEAWTETELLREAARRHASSLIDLAEAEVKEFREEVAHEIEADGQRDLSQARPDAPASSSEAAAGSSTGMVRAGGPVDQASSSMQQLLTSLGVALDSATAIQGALERLGDAQARPGAGAAASAVQVVRPRAADAPAPAGVGSSPGEPASESRSLGWLFRTSHR